LGPVSWIDALQRAIGDRMEAYRTKAVGGEAAHGRISERPAPEAILVLDHWFVLCGEPIVQAVER
jgi:hypothetical protein